MLELIAVGFSEIASLECLLLIAAGVVVGIIFGSIPGLSATMAIALCLPMTYGLAPISGMALLIGLYIGGISGGLVAAILLRIPGTPSSVATCFDGYPLAAKGEGGKALGVGIFFSFLGTIFGILILMCISPFLAKIALKFSFYEYFAVGVFSMTMMASLISGSVVKGLASGAIGFLIAMVGAAPIDGLPRLTLLFPSTYHLVGAEQFHLMKPTAYIINAARGPVVDEAALIEALKNGAIAGAGLDVFEQEPPAPDNLLFSMENVILSPHNAALSDGALWAMAMDSAAGIVDYLEGRTPKYPCNPDVLPTRES